MSRYPLFSTPPIPASTPPLDDLVFGIHRPWRNIKLGIMAGLSVAALAIALASGDARFLLPLAALVPAMVWLLAHSFTAAIIVRGFEVVVRSGVFAYSEHSDHIAEARLSYSADPIGRLLGYEHVACSIAGVPRTVRCVASTAQLKREIQRRLAIWQSLTASRVSVNASELAVGAGQRPSS